MRAYISIIFLALIIIVSAGCGTSPAATASATPSVPIYFDASNARGMRIYQPLWRAVFSGTEPKAGTIKVIEEDFSYNGDSLGIVGSSRYYVKVELVVNDRRIILIAKEDTDPSNGNRREDAVQKAIASLAKKAQKQL